MNVTLNFNCTSSVLFVGDHSLSQYSLQTILAQGGIHLFLVLGGQFLVSPPTTSQVTFVLRPQWQKPYHGSLHVWCIAAFPYSSCSSIRGVSSSFSHLVFRKFNLASSCCFNLDDYCNCDIGCPLLGMFTLTWRFSYGCVISPLLLGFFKRHAGGSGQP